MFLSDEELRMLTGYTYAVYQIQWLNQQGFKFVVNGEGKPVLLRSHVEARLSSVSNVLKNSTAPNWSTFTNDR